MLVVFAKFVKTLPEDRMRNEETGAGRGFDVHVNLMIMKFEHYFKYGGL